ncbi:unnamed protein product [Fraxinus pennsylvanica]|uniref:EF-hand domain-containing protein n=1 Tax=Fraxinus pennsylvanica TaxID=56036 RepID=A0AAD1ZEN1_9LAMI|nr:unnamed protein product [Fraxinus pennsylvanica]
MSNCSSSDVGRDRESFPLSSFDYNSSLGPCDYDDDGQNDVDAYIEIELEPAKTLTPGTRENKGEANEDEVEDEEAEFRISFSTVCRKSSSANVFSFPATYSGDASDSAAGSKTVTIFPPTWKRLEPPADEDFQSNEYEQTATINQELLQSRKAPKATGAMKMLVKFRSISFRSMLTSLLKLGKFTPSTVKTQQVYVISEVRPENRRSSLNPFDKLFRQKARRGRRTGESSKPLEINLEGIRKLFDTGAIKTANHTRQAKSCPNSIKSSPINENRNLLLNIQLNKKKKKKLQCRWSLSLNTVCLHRIFNIFGINNDGTITLDELSQAVGHLGLNSNRAELESMIQSDVQPGNADLTYKYFVEQHVLHHFNFHVFSVFVPFLDHVFLSSKAFLCLVVIASNIVEIFVEVQKALLYSSTSNETAGGKSKLCV